MSRPPDDVSRIHNRFSLTLLNPSSHYFSMVAAVALSVATSLITHFAYLGDMGSDAVWHHTAAVVAVLVLTQLLDTRFTRKKEYSKSLHSSLFANILWTLSVATGMLPVAVLGGDASPFFVVLGMFLFASFRIGIYTTTLGASLRTAWAICMVQPLAMFLVLMPQGLWIPTLSDPISLVYGIAFMIIASVWSRLTDTAGRPGMRSTHETIQAYLASQGNDYSDAESIMEGRSREAEISTSQIRFSSDDGGTEFRVVLPEIHPGPYHPVGGSNIPYLIFKNFSSSAMVMHSISDHALNLPSRNAVEVYLKNLKDSSVTDRGLRCTEPVTVQINKARVTGMLFENRPLLFLSLSPHGMEDIPSYMKTEIERYATNRNHGKAMIVDCHNAMGGEISTEDGQDMLNATKSCLDTLATKENYPIEIGYANSDEMGIDAEDLGLGGLGVACMAVNGKKYFFGWADANNMENGVREEITETFKGQGMRLVEICTSDTHYARVKARNKNGYYQLGLITETGDLTEWLLQIAGNAEANVRSARYEILENCARVRVMGHEIFGDYSRALEKSLSITKRFVVGGVILFSTSLFL